MKLKALHIRNIASIERADIDFEHGLNDAITGEPASIFLISGDTGAGKSVILDGISMALYKKTPRIADVANVTKNEYTDAQGESIRVASIEQYTRLGISERDSSYSEVVFEGNDGKTYHARLTLGVRLGNRDKTTGIRPLKHKTPVWEIRIGDDDWTKDSVERTILNAVGLDFQQFGRMAMLAQGQFANFLTGDKKEREAILEQLTNTQHFTAYGEAISSLWKKAKEAQAQIQTQYDTEKTHTLTDEQVELIAREMSEAQKATEQYEREIKATEWRLKQIDVVLQSEKTQTEAMQTRQALETIFRQLTADLADRQAKAKTQQDAISKMEEWMSRQSCYDSLYTKAGETDLKIEQYLEKMKKAVNLVVSLQQEQAKTEGLQKNLSEATAHARKTDEEVQKRQAQIDALSKQRSELNPQAVNAELRKQNDRRQALADLQKNIDNLKPMIEEHRKLQAGLQSESEEMKSAQEAVRNADANYQTKKLEADKAAQRLTTMKMSLDDKIKELRHRLYDEHTENCPLCGQHIGHIHLDDDFRGMLTPLEDEKQRTNEQLIQAEKLRDQAIGRFRQLDGTHKSSLKLYESNDKKIETLKQTIENQAAAFGFQSPVVSHLFAIEIAEAIDRLASSIAKLETAQREAELLQNEINSLIKDKLPYDNKKTEADKSRLRAEAAVKVNADNIVRIEREHESLTMESKTIKAEISARLAGYCDNWLTDTERLRKQLKDDANTYNERRKQLSDSMAAQEKTNTLTETLTSYREDILRACPDWTATTAPQAYPCQNINTEWTSLIGKVTSLLSKMNDCRRQREAAFKELGITDRAELPDKQAYDDKRASLGNLRDEALSRYSQAKVRLDLHQKNVARLKEIESSLEAARQRFARWDRLNNIFGGTRFRTLVQTYILRPLLNNANIYLEQITDRYRLTCSEANEQLSILVLDRYNKDQVRSVTVLSGGERFMISLALSLALSSLNRPDMNVNILFIDEGFGTLDENSLDSVMSTLEKLQEIAGETNRRVGIISHREELSERIPVKIHVVRKGEGRSLIEVKP